MNKIYEEKKIDKMMYLFLIIIPFVFAYMNYKTYKYSLVSIIPSIYFITSRDYYLPFLGDTVLPTYLLKERIPENYDIELKVKIPKNTKVIYWASEPGKKDRTPWDAYKNYENSGVTTSDSDGVAVFKVREPGRYVKPMMFGTNYLKPHIHYRLVKTNGMLDKIKTINL